MSQDPLPADGASLQEVRNQSSSEKHTIASRAEDYSQWYLDIIDVAELAENAPVRGCMIIKPYGYAIWENIQRILDARFKETGVKNAYFPLFIPQSFFAREAEHVEGFSPELAIVTHAGGKKLEEPLAIRPTSETIIYDAYSRWVQSYRDLPLVLNQWVNVVRWELRTRPFLRTTEFLWQEGHTAHADEADAQKRTIQMLEVYKKFVQEILAIPVIDGQKSDSERFAGAERTYTIEALMQDGKALQSGTSHMLGTSFAKAFNVSYLDKEGGRQFVWLTSWGVSTRLIGGLIMTHSDDKGLILPPNIAPIQVVIIPIWSTDAERDTVFAKAQEYAVALKSANVRVEIDMSDEGRPGPKFFAWEKKGVPLRIELGPKDIEAQSVIAVRRDNSEKQTVSGEGLVSFVSEILPRIQQDLFDKALAYQKERTYSVNSWDEFKEKIELGGFLMAHWDGTAETEAKIKEETKATIRCVPFDSKDEDGVCVYSGKPSKKRVLFARAY